MDKIQKQETEIRNIKAKNEILSSEIIELESAERISKIAEEKLGLSKPTKIPIVIEETEN